MNNYIDKITVKFVDIGLILNAVYLVQRRIRDDVMEITILGNRWV